MTQERPRRDRSWSAVAALRKHPGTRRRFEVAGPIAELEVTNSRVPEGSDVDVDVVLESILGGVVATGTVSAAWEGECRRCLEPATGRSSREVREVYSDDPDPELDYADDRRLARPRTARPRCLYPRAAARAPLWARLPRALSGAAA